VLVSLCASGTGEKEGLTYLVSLGIQPLGDGEASHDESYDGGDDVAEDITLCQQRGRATAGRYLRE